MATVRLSDAIIPEVYNSYTTDNNPERTPFFLSGAVVRNALLDAAANEAGKMTHVPFWKDVDPNIEPTYSSDDPASLAVPQKIGSGEMQARKAWMNHSFQTADLVSELAGSNPMQRIRDRFGFYWMGQWQRRSIATLVGVCASNIAQNAGDMVVDVSIADGAAATAANLFSREVFVDAAYTLGDRASEIKAIAVHSVVMKRMVNNDDITFVADSDGQLTVPTYMGRAVLVDDMLPAVAGGTSGFVYTSVLFGAAAMGYGEGTPLVKSAVTRDELAADGGGIETIIERNTWMIHPFGFTWKEATVTGGLSAKFADLKLAANWGRTTARKNIPIAFLKTNG